MSDFLSPSALFLIPEEIATLTGRKRAKGQIEWLTGHGFTFEVGADGKPKVLVAHVNERLGARAEPVRVEPELHL